MCAKQNNVKKKKTHGEERKSKRKERASKGNPLGP